MADTDVIRKSVTQGDYASNPREGVMHFLVPYGMGGIEAGLPPDPPRYWSRERDYVLRQTVDNEDMWAGAIAIAITKMTSLDWEVESKVPLRAKRAQELLLGANWVGFLSKHLRDYLTTDNGAFIEIVRAAPAAGSRIMGLVHLDSLRCTRTGDPDVPVIYRDRKGREHEMKAHQVIMISDMPDPGETWFGVGKCAAARAYRSIYKLAAIERFVSEKVSGRRPLSLYFVNAVSPQMLNDARLTAEADADRRGLMSYMGAVVVPILDAERTPQVATVPLAELPDGFNRKEEFDIAVLTFANAIGLDPQDLQPLTGQPLGTGAQSQVLEEKSKGKGLAAWRQEFPHLLNEMVLDEKTTFYFIEKDYRDMERAAMVSEKRSQVAKIRIEAGITQPEQEKQIMVDLDELPKEFLPEDQTPGDSLSDDEKPDAEGQPAPAETIPEPVEPETKEASDPAAVLELEIDSARKLFEEVTNEQAN